MTTQWTIPTLITQYAEEGADTVHIPWDKGDSVIQEGGYRSFGTLGALYHIARSPKLDLVTKTYYVNATGFNFTNLPETISGIEVRIKTKRAGRVTDDTVQLCLDDNLIGENKATLNLSAIKIYGNSNDKWTVDNISLQNVQNSSFGVAIRFQSHPQWPHRDAAYIDLIEMRIH